eukprot:5069533-Ditylum_brightwellii.AAC.1
MSVMSIDLLKDCSHIMDPEQAKERTARAVVASVATKADELGRNIHSANKQTTHSDALTSQSDEEISFSDSNSSQEEDCIMSSLLDVENGIDSSRLAGDHYDEPRLLEVDND